MFRSFRISWRIFLRDRVYSGVTLATLSIGLAVGLIMIHYVNNQVSFDSFFDDADRIYRVERRVLENGNELFSDINTFPALANELNANFSEFAHAARVLDRSGLVKSGLKTFNENNMIHADQGFLDIFSLNFIEGSKNKALDDPNAIIISEKFRSKYFEGDALGEFLAIGAEEVYQITGVYASMPGNSHFNFEAILSYNQYANYERLMSSWHWNNARTYVKLSNGMEQMGAEKQLIRIEQTLRDKVNKQETRQTELFLIPLTELHYKELDSSTKAILWGMGILAIIIMSIGWLNYLNLWLSKISSSRKAIGIKKAIGARYHNFIIEQFSLTSIYLFLSLIIAVSFVVFFLPSFNERFDAKVDIFSSVSAYLTTVILLGYVVIILLISFVPMDVIRSIRTSLTETLSHSITKSQFFLNPNSLLAFQFVIVICTVGGSLAINNQIDYMLSADKNFNNTNILIIKPPGIFNDYDQGMRSFKSQCKQLHNVKNVSLSSSVPGEVILDAFTSGIHVAGEQPPLETIYLNYSDENYISTYEMKISKGNNLSEVSAIPKAILNKSAVKAFEETEEELIGKYVVTPYDSALITGIIQDFNQSSLKNRYSPQVIIDNAGEEEEWGYLSIKFTNEIDEVDLLSIKSIWAQIFPDSPFDYFRNEAFFDSQYNQESDFMKLFYFVSAICIVLSAVGLLGFTLGLIETNKKPFAIRKSIGSSELNITFLISRSYLKGVLYANVISIPVIILLYYKWLDTYSFHESIQMNVFVLPSLILLTFCSISIAINYLVNAKVNLAKQLNDS